MRLRSRSRSTDSGFTLVEVVVGVLLVSIGIVAVLSAVVSSNHLTSTAQVREAAINFAEQQLDTLRQQKVSALGMTGTPSSDAANANDPNHYVSTSGGPACLQIEDNFQAGGTARWCETFLTGGTVTSGPQTISGVQGLTGTYDIYVTRHWEATSGASNGCVGGTSPCLSGSDEARVTVAVAPNTKLVNGVLQNTTINGGNHKPIWLSTIITNSATPTAAQ